MTIPPGQHMSGLGRLWRGGIKRTAHAVILLYRGTLGPLVGGQCRFEPSCSRFAEEAFAEHAPLRALMLTIGRLLRCHPLSRGGYDPVPVPEARKPEGDHP